MHHFVAVAVSAVLPTHTGSEATALLLRWTHFVAGITWVGLLYFFNLVNVPFMKQVDAAMKPKIFQYMTLPALNWFRWSSVVTVFVGFWYWAQMYVGPDARAMGVSPWGTIGLFLLVWIVAWALMYFVIAKTPSGYVVGAVGAVVCIAAAWLFVNYTPRRPGRQPRAVDRRGRRLRHRDALERLGHHLAQQQEDYSRNAGWHAARQRGCHGPPGFPGVAHEFLPVGALAVFHGHQLPLRDSGSVTPSVTDLAAFPSTASARQIKWRGRSRAIYQSTT